MALSVGTTLKLLVKIRNMINLLLILSTKVHLELFDAPYLDAGYLAGIGPLRLCGSSSGANLLFEICAQPSNVRGRNIIVAFLDYTTK